MAWCTKSDIVYPGLIHSVRLGSLVFSPHSMQTLHSRVACKKLDGDVPDVQTNYTYLIRKAGIPHFRLAITITLQILLIIYGGWMMVPGRTQTTRNCYAEKTMEKNTSLSSSAQHEQSAELSGRRYAKIIHWKWVAAVMNGRSRELYEIFSFPRLQSPDINKFLLNARW